MTKQWVISKYRFLKLTFSRIIVIEIALIYKFVNWTLCLIQEKNHRCFCTNINCWQSPRDTLFGSCSTSHVKTISQNKNEHSHQTKLPVHEIAFRTGKDKCLVCRLFLISPTAFKRRMIENAPLKETLCYFYMPVMQECHPVPYDCCDLFVFLSQWIYSFYIKIIVRLRAWNKGLLKHSIIFISTIK